MKLFKLEDSYVGSRLSALGSRLSALGSLIINALTRSSQPSHRIMDWVRHSVVVFVSLMAVFAHAGPAVWTGNGHSNVIGATPSQAAQADASRVGSSVDFNGFCTAKTVFLYSCGFNWNAYSVHTLNPDARPGQYAGTLDYAAGCRFNSTWVSGRYNNNGVAWCSDNASQISLNGPAETRPVGTAGSAPVIFTAKVSDGATPKAGVPISFAVEVIPNSGGHDHHDINRPKAKLSAVQGTTDANGEVRMTFTAPEPAGIHTIKATCATCSNSPAVKEIKVKVPDLIQIPPDTQTPPRYVLVGQRPEHRKSHFVTEAGLDALNQVIRVFARLGWGQVGINDASLEWGGMFDIEGKWLKPYMNNKGKWVTGGHAEHRNGEQVDISFARPASVSMQLRKKAFREVCNNNRTSLSPDILWHENDGYAPHFHIYLTGKVGAPAAGKNNQCTEK